MTLNALAIFAHPDNQQSLNAGLLECTKQACKDAGANLTINDLYQKEFQPVLTAEDLAGSFSGNVAEDVQQEQQLVANADVIIIHHPVFWFDRPAILKGWFDRVFTSGFAFTMSENGTEGLLTGKKARVVQTAGTPKKFYQALEANQYPHTGIERGTLSFCGFEAQTLTHYNIFAVDNASREQMKKDTYNFVLQTLVNQKR